MFACLAKISPMNWITGERIDIYLSSAGDPINGPKVNGLGGFVWEPATITPPSLSISLWNGDFTASVSPGQATLPINLATVKKSYPAIDTAGWVGAPIVIYVEEPGTAWPWTERFVGRISSWDGAYPRVNLVADVDQQPFTANVLADSYAGTGGIEGGSDLANQLKPLIFGWAQNVEPLLIDAVNNVYQFSGYGPIEAVTTLYERGSDFGPSIGDVGTYDALVASTIPAGKWATCLGSGLIRLGAPAYGVITGDVKGHVVGSSTPRLTGSIISALAALTEVSAGSTGAVIETSPLGSITSVVPVITPGPGAILSAALGDVAAAPIADVATASPASIITAAPGDIVLPELLSIDTGTATAPLASIVTAPPAAFDAADDPVIETESLAALNAAVPYPINIVVTEQETFLDLARRLVLPCNYTAGVSLLGKFFVAAVGFGGDEVLTLNAQGRAVPQVLTATEESVSAPYTKTTMGAARSWRVHSADEIAFQATLVEQGRYDAAKTYREGNIVDVEDGSRWVYINTVASAGNAPPDWPATSNDYWSDLTPPTTGDFYTPALSAPTQNIAASSTGSVSSYAGLGGTFTLRHNNMPLTSGVTFSVVSESGIDVSINSATGAYTVNSMSANTGTAKLRASYSGFTWDLTYTLSKTLQGIAGATGSGTPGAPGTPAPSIIVTKKAVSVLAYADGSLPDGSLDDAAGQLTVWSGTTEVTAGATLTAIGANCSGTINTAANTPVAGRPKGYYQIDAISPDADTATLTLHATYGGQTLTEIFSISKNKDGYAIVDALPTNDLFDGRVVSLSSDNNRLYVYSNGAWSNKVVPSQLTASLGSINPDPTFLDFNYWTTYVDTAPTPVPPLSNNSSQPVFIEDTDFGDHFTRMGASRLLAWRNDNDFAHKYYIVNGAEMPMQGDGRSVTVRFRFRNHNHCSFLIGLEFFDASGTSIGGVFKTVAADAGVADYSAQGAIPAGTAFARFTMRNNKDGTGGNDWALLSGLQAFFSIDTDLLTSDAVKANNIAAGSIVAAKLASTELITLSAQIRDGVINNAKIGDAEVNTLKIAGQSVTVPMSTYEPGTLPFNKGVPTVLRSLTIVTSGAPVELLTHFLCGANASNNLASATIEITRDGTTIFSETANIPMAGGIGQASLTAAIQDQPSAGTHTYRTVVTLNSVASGATGSAGSQYLRSLETKR